MASPTAVHARGEVQETAVNSATGPAGFGTRWRDQVVPFQVSAMGNLPPLSGE
jgi:hypothetical protein